MAVNGFLQFAGESTNIITDEEYAESSVRVNGVTSGKAVSTLHNKMYLQWSTIAYVIGQLIADAGYAATDSDADVLLGNLKNAIGATVGGKIFTAYYGTTTYAEVESAISAGKIVFVHDIPAAGEETLYVYEYSDNSNVYFSSAYSKNNTEGSFGWLRINVSNTWTKGSADVMIKGVDYVTAGKKSGTTLGTKATAEGRNTTASGVYSHAEGDTTEATGSSSHAEGYTAKASGQYAHAEGNTTAASGTASHAEGASSNASGNEAHAEGVFTVASGLAAHAEGTYSEASGRFSHAEGEYTIAKNKDQHTFGAFNEQDPSVNDGTSRGEYIEIVGNGTSNSNRSNARTLDWNGNEVLAGKLTMGADPAGDMDAVPKKWLDSAFVTETITNEDIASFDDGADNIPVKSFTGSIIPVQNLNGYDNPWPAGGSKNKFNPATVYYAVGYGQSIYKSPVTYGSVTVSGNTISITRSARYSSVMLHLGQLPAGTYTWSDGQTSNILKHGIVKSATYGEISSTSVAGSNFEQVLSETTGSLTFTADGTSYYWVDYYGGSTSDPLNATIPYVQLETGSEATSFAPYSNVCPISEWSGAEICRRGINLWDEEWEVGNISGATGQNEPSNLVIRAANYIPVKPSTTYYFKSGTTAQHILFYYKADKTYIQDTATLDNGSFTTPSDCYYVRFRMATAYGTTYNNDISINYPSTDTTYHAYDGQTITLAFGSTVYAGTITALGGGLWSVQPTHEMSKLKDHNWTYGTYDGATCFTANDFTARKSGKTFISSVYPTGNGRSVQYAISPYNASSTSKNVYINDPTYTDAPSLIAMLTATDATILYELATLPDPIIVNASDLATLLGSNNVWTDCGSVMELTYRADTKLYIDKIIGSGSQTVVIDGGSF